MWEFENYCVYDEEELFRFENIEGDTIGYIVTHHSDDKEVLINDLNNGADPIEDRWEDGMGNTISIYGWGNDENGGAPEFGANT